MRKSVFSRRTLIARSSSLIRPADRRSGVGTLDQGPSRELDELVIPLAALLVVLALAGCAQGTADQAGAPYAPYPPETNGNVPEHGGGGGGGGGDGSM